MRQREERDVNRIQRRGVVRDEGKIVMARKRVAHFFANVRIGCRERDLHLRVPRKNLDQFDAGVTGRAVDSDFNQYDLRFLTDDRRQRTESRIGLPSSVIRL